MCPFWKGTVESTDSKDHGYLAVGHICLDLTTKAATFRESLARFLTKHRKLLSLDNDGDIVGAYLQRVWPNGAPGSLIVSHASFDSSDKWILRPPVEGPLASAFAAKGLVPAFTGYRGPGALVIDGFAPTDHILPRPFERRVSATIYTTNGSPLMTPEDLAALAQLPRQRHRTYEQLGHWQDCLRWRKTLAYISQIGVPYERYELHEDGRLTFAIRANGELARLARSPGTIMFITPLTSSLSRTRWTPIPRYRPPLIKVGQLEKAWRADTDHRSSQQTATDDGEDGYHLAFVTIRPQTEGNASYDGQEIPDQGFLLTGVGGDLKPINSETFAIERFCTGKGHNLYLADYLFDTRITAVPSEIPDVFAGNPPLVPLDEHQRAAVNRALAAPDIALIQGPPGNGKTTGITEICHQEVRRGHRVLVVSQANGAVDNVLSRLSAATIIRPLRVGKSEHVEPEGLPFLGPAAAQTWLQAVSRTCRQRIKADRLRQQKVGTAQEAFPRLQDLFIRFQEASAQINHLSNRRGDLTDRLSGLDSQHRSITDQVNRLRRVQAALADIAQTSQGAILNTSSWDLLSGTRLPHLATACVKGMIGALSLAPWPLVWLVAQDGFNALTLLASVRRAIHGAGLLMSSLPEALSLCAAAGTAQSTQSQEIAKLLAQRAVLLNSSQDEDLLKVAAINRRIRQLQEQSWGRECRALKVPIQMVFSDAIPLELDRLISSLGPDPEFISMLERLSTLCETLTRRCRQVLDEGHVRIIQQANVDRDAMEEQIRQHAGELDDLGDQLETLRGQIDGIDEQLHTLHAQQEGYRSGWSQLWPSVCPDMDRPEAAPPLAADALDRRRQAFANWLAGHVANGPHDGRWQKIQQEWIRRLDGQQIAEDTVLGNLYTAHANVVGLTCLESGQRSFYEDEDFEPFDVVIIDEVSKATPTELLMAMMLARKVILVGDQRQLPPMFKEKESSFAEALADGRIQAADFERFGALVTGSFFGELFERADDSIRQSLFYHYRSHPQIMSVFNVFYDDRLLAVGGAPSLGNLRQHYLRLKDRNGGWFLEPDQHVLWIDSSRRADGQVFTERQAGSSKVNLLEIELILASLVRLNWGLRSRGYGPCRTVKITSSHAGLTIRDWVRQLLPGAKSETLADLFARQQIRIDGHAATADSILKTGDTVVIDARMPIGVITFYGAQLGGIRRKIAELTAKEPCLLDACHIQSNTVDKFQGKEMPIVLVSLVRAPGHRHVGQFVKEYRRVNVAFSRAQNLLIIVGSERTFRHVPVEIPRIEDGIVRKVYAYQQILELITQYGGLRYARDLLKW